MTNQCSLFALCDRGLVHVSFGYFFWPYYKDSLIFCELNLLNIDKYWEGHKEHSHNEDWFDKISCVNVHELFYEHFEKEN